ncbi:MAG: glycosyltransferase [Planctomycetaceae bacterium]|nr:glycosyltransferase [Planctomycetaceae bacterium]
MIRVAFVIPTLDQSGAERQLTLLATGLPRDRYIVKVFALNRGGHYADQLRNHGIEVEVLEKRFRFDLLTWIRLRRGLAEFCPDFVQSYLFAANAYVRLPAVCPPRARVIVCERCVDSWKSAWQLKIDRWMLGRTWAMTANSRGVADFYMSIGVPVNFITVIPNGMPRPKQPVDPAAERQKARQTLGLRSDDRVVGFVGRLARQKRLQDLIWSFQLLRQTITNGKLVLIGDGPERVALEELAINLDCRHLIHFAGHRSDAYQLAAAFDVFVLPSEFEGMSNSLMEAMSLRLPVVASDIAPNQELIQHETTGLLYPVGKSADLTMAMKRLFDDMNLAEKLADAGQQKITESHCVEHMVARHCQLYESGII